MKVIKKKKQKGSFLLRTAIFAFAIYTIVALVNQQVQISQKRQELAAVKQKIVIQQVKNEDIKHALSTGANGNSDYIERVARESLNFAKPGERVFVNIAGN
ncbi:septum formation initiator family protein [Clostridium sp. KNHs216]|jgi:cell division protein DivIC|uniref:FtsB family cell division protein n=1 Tax=Eubacteriales TaxID=186802 RepID=UPI0005712CE7|nr:septum formation initiator family protein [Clostridium sp. KNHs216]MBE6830744.1 septum formation initiator family protein [Oscillospiraceae bacterium]TQI65814.1 septum formation initiator [Clostridium sp. KNHs216]